MVDFLPEPELSRFKTWLRSEASTLLEEQSSYGGDRVSAWVAANRERVLRGDVESIYLPRVWIGKFFRARIEKLVEEAERSGHITLETKVAEVQSIQQRNRADSTAGYRVTLSAEVEDETEESGKNVVITSQRVVVAIGAPPVARQWKQSAKDHSALLVENLYEPFLDENLQRLKTHVALLREKIQTERFVVSLSALTRAVWSFSITCRTLIPSTG